MVVAEPVGLRFKDVERHHVCLRLRRIRASRREGNAYRVAGVFRRLLDGGAAAQNDQVGQRHLFAARLRGIERLLDSLEGLQRLLQPGRLVDRPIFLRCETNPRPVGPAAHVGAAERGG